ncbi:hypothetical protein B566_EDAN017690, partial [Ephemera danica]
MTLDKRDGCIWIQRNDVKHVLLVAKVRSDFLVDSDELFPILKVEQNAWCSNLVDPNVGLESIIDVVPHSNGLGPRLVDVVRHCEYFHLDVSTANELPSTAQILITATRLARSLAGFHGTKLLKESLHDVTVFVGTCKPEGKSVETTVDPTCKVCLTNAADVLFLPCKHLASCRSCKLHLENCPICRTECDSIIVVSTIGKQDAVALWTKSNKGFDLFTSHLTLELSKHLSYLLVFLRVEWLGFIFTVVGKTSLAHEHCPMMLRHLRADQMVEILDVAKMRVAFILDDEQVSVSLFLCFDDFDGIHLSLLVQCKDID